MSYNISEKVLKHSSKVTVDINLRTFTQRQKVTMVNSIKRGAITLSNTSAQALLCKTLLDKYNLPYIAVGSWRVRCVGVNSDHPIREFMLGQYALLKLTETHPYWLNSINESMAKVSNWSGHTIDIQYYPLNYDIKKDVKKMRVPLPDAHPINDELNRILSEDITTYQVVIHGDE